MKTKLQELVESLAIKHGLRLGWDDCELALSVAGYEHRLVIESMNEVLVNIGYRAEDAQGQYIEAYAVFFYTRDSPWVIVEAETPEYSITGATLETRQSEYYCASVFDQEEVIKALAQWMERLNADEWLANAVVVVPSNEPACRPSFSDLSAWMEQGGCEALDGCWVEPDGTCEHGHPSWLLHYGLI
jgi:hypothetical protein